MTPAVLRATLRVALATIRWGPAQLHAAAGCSRSLANHWIAGTRTVPVPVAAWLCALAEAHAAAPHPIGWVPQPGRKVARAAITDPSEQ